MRKLRWNWPVWLGFVLSVIAFVSYFRFFARFPVTRNVPWANFLLFGASAAFLWAGLRRSLGEAQAVPWENCKLDSHASECFHFWYFLFRHLSCNEAVADVRRIAKGWSEGPGICVA